MLFEVFGLVVPRFDLDLKWSLFLIFDMLVHILLFLSSYSLKLLVDREEGAGLSTSLSLANFYLIIEN